MGMALVTAQRCRPPAVPFAISGLFFSLLMIAFDPTNWRP
jgi:hypothetical protein